MTSARDDICQAALRLFLKNGYENVSLRDIAEQAGTSIGNLTHHFPRKECLLAELQKSYQSEIPLKKEYSKDPEKLLINLIQTFFAAEKNENAKSFYYHNICEFYNDSEEVRTNVNSFQSKLFDYFYTTFIYLREQNILKRNFSLDDYLNIAYLYVMMGTFWISKASPYHAAGMPTLSIADSMYMILNPYVTEDHKQTYIQIYMKYRKAISKNMI